jgi:uncharacterized metal-binding protein
VSFEGRVAVMPCTGVGQVVGTIARQAAYRVCEDLRPEDTVLLCLPALVRGVQEDLDMAKDCPVVVIEGCKHGCAAHALALQGSRPAASVSVPQVLLGKGLAIAREARRALRRDEQAAVELVAASVAEAVAELQGTPVRLRA